MCDLLDFVANRTIGDIFEIVILFCCVKTRLRTFFQSPVKARHQAQGPQHARRLFQECVVLENAEVLGFEIGNAVERIHQESARARIQRQSHGIDGEIAPAQVLVDGLEGHLGLSRFGIALRARAGNLRPDVIGKEDIKDAHVLVTSLNNGADLLQVLLQLEDVALNGKVEVPDWESADDVAHRAAGEIDVHLVRAGDFLHLSHDLELCRRQPALHHVYVVSHSGSSLVPGRQDFPRADGPDCPSGRICLGSAGLDTVSQ